MTELPRGEAVSTHIREPSTGRIWKTIWKYVMQYKKKMKPNLIKVISNTKNDMK